LDYPKLRNVEAFPADVQGRRVVCLRDPQQIAPGMICLPPEIYFIVSLFDGEHSVLDIQTEYTRQFGELLFSDKVKQVIAELDDNLFLDSDRFRTHRAKQEDEFRKLRARPPQYAGNAYEDQPDALRRQIDGFFAHPDGPGRPKSRTHASPPRGLIAPHIDLRRGGPCYAWAYKEIAETAPADLYVILGTVHYPTERIFTATTKDFATPLGTVKTDVDAVNTLSKNVGGGLLRGELAHRAEHSIEFQTLFLKYALGNEADFRILPILCWSFDGVVPEGEPPSKAGEITDFLGALADTLDSYDGRTVVIAAADLAHMGLQFGDEERLSSGRLAWVEREDRQMLQKALAGDADGFYADVQKDGDRRRICGAPCVYSLLTVLQGANGSLLKYSQAVEPDGSSCVSFAAAAFP